LTAVAVIAAAALTGAICVPGHAQKDEPKPEARAEKGAGAAPGSAA
jgi:hypothetical protein